MHTDVRRCTTVRLYLPKMSEKIAVLAPLMKQAGGGTKWQADGGWLAAYGKVVAEQVEVFEFILTGLKHQATLDWIEELGRAFLQDNPAEQCFLAYVSGHAVKINRN